MKTATPLTAAVVLLALAACGEETSTEAQRPAQQSEAVRPAEPVKVAELAAEAEPETEAEPEAEAEPEPEPEDAVIAFRGEDGELAFARESLQMVSPVHDAENDVWSVFVQLDKDAAEKFYTLTTKTAGEAMSVVVGEMIVSAPVLENPVYGGGFVFDVDDGEVASEVVAVLTGGERRDTEPVVADAEPVVAEAGDALPEDETADDADAVASAEREEEE